MKTISKITIGLATAALLIVGCGEAEKAAPANTTKVKPIINEESLGLRKTDLYAEKSETVGVKTAYDKNAAGSGKFIERAFQDAPPMIPHDVEGMLPITIKDNQCISCHAPEVAKDMAATPYPSSHMTNFRADTAIGKNGKITKSGIEVENTSSDNLKNISIIKKDRLVGARFNCTLCHAPQSGEGQLVENNFEADFTSKDGARKSAWSGTKLMEGIDTTK
jgi:cytochrome c-type protein NapB